MKSLLSRQMAGVAVSAFALSACGGGGGGGTESPGPAPPSNPSLNTITPSVLTVAQAQLIAGRVASVVGMLGSFSAFSEIAYDNFEAFGAASRSNNCGLSGSVTRLQTDTDGNRRVSAGDSLGVIGNACRDEMDDGGAVQMDGRYDISVLAVSGTPYTTGSTWTARNSQTYSAYTLATSQFSLRFDGSVEVEDAYRLRTYRFLGVSQASAITQNFIQLASGSATFETSGLAGSSQAEVLVGFKDMAVVTNLSAAEMVNVKASTSATTPWRFVNGDLVAGTLVLQLDKAKITVTALTANQVRLDVDNNNDGSVDATQTFTATSLISNATL